MNKAELTKNIAARLQTSNTGAERFLDALNEAVIEGLLVDGEVALPFGKLKTIDRPARKARNPMTGETVHVPGKTVAKFTASKALRETVNS